MNTAFWIGLGIAVIYIIYLIVLRVTSDSLDESKFTDVVSSSASIIIVVGFLMFLGGIIIGFEDSSETRERYEDAILNNTWQIKTTHEIILSEEGDTLEYEMKRKVVIPPKITEE